MLSGQRVWVTRPAAQSAGLLTRLREAGAVPVALPLLEIAPAADPAALDAALAELAHTDLAIFVSPSAMDAVMARLGAAWPAQVPVAVVGPGSQRRAEELGMTDIISPATRFDSEGLLAEPRMQALAGRRVVLFRGDGGRELLPDALRERGARLQVVSAYRRLPPAFDSARLGAALDAGCDGAIISSSEAAHYLFTQFEASYCKRLQSVLYFTPHPRIAAALAEHGATRVVATEAGDAGIVTSLCRHFNRTP
ncbi:uroporphyrinogen-III synthase [Silvimonas iriomotensis]|uniref:Uroporphyrinogen-III synthase n=1 Tax=Silvimonas iriomotensis TaxID=449662 RepID=A0ABQ2PEW0_9NEIS|nr:uroporphyrinogen-III synthase [Silvimonas iriomotensis]GGP23921.1 hypothetical protein GCM10010970_39210 [Silvimonas iriomotensis]